MIPGTGTGMAILEYSSTGIEYKIQNTKYRHHTFIHPSVTCARIQRVNTIKTAQMRSDAFLILTINKSNMYDDIDDQ